MEFWLILVLSGLIGLGTGFLSGMLGIGGGSIRIPLLTLLGFDLLTSFGMNLFAIPFSSIFSASTHYENLDIKTTLFLALGGCSGTAVGIIIAIRLSISGLVLPIIFLISSILTVIGINLYKLVPKFSEKLRPTAFSLIFGGFVLNLVTGLKGGSGGSLFPPYMKALNIEMHKAIANSLLATFFTSLVGITIYYFHGFLFSSEGLVIAISSIIGAKIGSVVSLKSKSRFLEITLSIMVLLLASVPLVKRFI